MKPRNREINIFNMSLLDILCGALGTFCFMMIVLFPYYSGRPSKAPEVPKGLVDPQTLQDALDQIKQLKESLAKMQGYSKQLEGQIEQQKQEAGKTNDHVSNLEMRNPFIGWTILQQNSPMNDLELYWDTDRVQQGKTMPIKLDPTRHQVIQFYGDLGSIQSNMAYHAIRDCPPGEYRLVLKIIKGVTPVRGWITIQMADFSYVSPYVKSERPQVAIPIAKIKMGPAPEYNYTFEWTVPKEFNDEPDWKPVFPDRGKQAPAK